MKTKNSKLGLSFAYLATKRSRKEEEAACSRRRETYKRGRARNVRPFDCEDFIKGFCTYLNSFLR